MYEAVSFGMGTNSITCYRKATAWAIFLGQSQSKVDRTHPHLSVSHMRVILPHILHGANSMTETSFRGQSWAAALACQYYMRCFSFPWLAKGMIFSNTGIHAWPYPKEILSVQREMSSVWKYYCNIMDRCFNIKPMKTMPPNHLWISFAKNIVFPETWSLRSECLIFPS